MVVMILLVPMKRSKSTEIEVLRQQLAEQTEENKRLHFLLEKLQQQLELLLKRLYGKRSEKQQKLEQSISVDNNKHQNKSKTQNTTSNNRTSRNFPKTLAREQIFYALPKEQLSCTCCGKELRCIGQETTEQLDFKPAQLYVKEHIRKKYACSCGGCGVKVASMPAQPIDKGIPGPGLLAEIITAKYQDALPLYRQEQRFARHGYLISRNTMVDWVKQSHILLTGIVDAMKVDLFMAYNIFTDDTPVPVQAKGKTKKGRLWVYATNGLSSAKCIIYDYSANRSQLAPKTFLAGYNGYLQADAYPGYDKLYQDGKLIEVACFAHMRRKFIEIQDAVKGATLADDAIKLIADIYSIETKTRDFTYLNRYYYRKKHAKSKLLKLYRWLKKYRRITLPNTPINAAISYSLNHWRAFQNYLADGRLEIDNNRAERAIKPVVIGRKNYLFAGSDEGGKRAATMYSIIETCKQNNINTFEYLQWVFTKIPSHTNNKIRELLPYHYKPSS